MRGMDLKEFLEPMTAEAREQFASRCVTSWGHLRNVIYGYRSCSPSLAVRIERESGKAIRCWTLRPDDWHLHWPHLVGTPGSPRQPRAAVQSRGGFAKAA